uniref:Uncharacterized protein n=1 Tax=Lepeophtheirus salmonis TaxID=72036 RepID=A0A0K2TKI4_LEPSM
MSIFFGNILRIYCMRL